MKKILIVADGKPAQKFLQRLISSDATKNSYYVVYYHDTTLPVTKVEKFKYCNFDPTSYSKLSQILAGEDFYQCMIIMETQKDTEATYLNIRQFDPKMPIVLLDQWGLKLSDKNLILIDAHDAISNIFSNFLPDIPLFAQNIGLGTGEIMEFNIPFGSPYVYRHVRNIDQKRWRISAVYRQNKLILPTPSTVLLPNDSILAVGNPNVLKGVFRSVKREFGQFPIPFGENIYCYIDMKHMSEEECTRLATDSMTLHTKFNSKKLIFKIVNVKYSKVLDSIKSYASTSILVEFDFYHQSLHATIVKDVETYYAGVIVTTQNFLSDHLKMFYTLKLPIFKIGKNGFEQIKEAVYLGSNSQHAEKVSSVIFDIATQLHHCINLFDVYLQKSEENEKIISHFQNLAKLFEEKVKVIQTKSNPILALKDRDDFLQFVIFEQRLLAPKLFSYFSTEIEKQFFRFREHYQLFIPSES